MWTQRPINAGPICLMLNPSFLSFESSYSSLSYACVYQAYNLYKQYVFSTNEVIVQGIDALFVYLMLLLHVQRQI
jgi:hypothetical protein